VAVVGAGEFFGETALLSDAPRNADVVALCTVGDDTTAPDNHPRVVFAALLVNRMPGAKLAWLIGPILSYLGPI
jgi:hypothetical protein